MITLAGFFIGLFLIGIGFLMIWKTRKWHEYVGSLNIVLGYPRLSWLDWNTLGIFLMIVGLLTTFGLVQTFIVATLGKLFHLSSLR